MPHLRSMVQYSPGGQEILLKAGLRTDQVFSDPRIAVWRDLPERQNCTLDLEAPLGRLHIKRYKAPHGADAEREARGIGLLEQAGISTVPLVAWGTDPSDRGFLITRHLANYVPADSIEAASLDRGRIGEVVADTALHLHAAGLHHRDLYLCHFLVNPEYQVSLIDPGRVARMPAPPLHLRWLVKDVAQLAYSIEDMGFPSGRLLLDRYMQRTTPVRRMVLRVFLPLKIASIARHDRKLRQKQPGRRVAIDTNP